MRQFVNNTWLTKEGFIKFTAVSLVLLWLWRNRFNRLARVASWIVFIMYGAIALYYAGILLAFI